MLSPGAIRCHPCSVALAQLSLRRSRQLICNDDLVVWGRGAAAQGAWPTPPPECDTSSGLSRIGGLTDNIPLLPHGCHDPVVDGHVGDLEVSWYNCHPCSAVGGVNPRECASLLLIPTDYNRIVALQGRIPLLLRRGS
jgi:hypothetical protein